MYACPCAEKRRCNGELHDGALLLRTFPYASWENVREVLAVQKDWVVGRLSARAVSSHRMEATRNPGAVHPLPKPGSKFRGNQQDVSIISAHLAPITMQGALVFPPMSVGMMEASATRNPSMPRTRSCGSTTAMSSTPIRQVPAGW